MSYTTKNWKFIDNFIVNTWFLLFFVSWPFIHPLEHNYTGQPAQFLTFFNLSTTMLTSAFKLLYINLNCKASWKLLMAPICLSWTLVTSCTLAYEWVISAQFIYYTACLQVQTVFILCFVFLHLLHNAE